MLGAGEADIGVLGLAGQRIGRLGVGRMSALELARLGAGRSEEDAEHHAKRVEGGQAGRDIAGHGEQHVGAAAIDGVGEDLVLGEPAGEEREAGQRQRADGERDEGERHGLPEATHAVEVLEPRHRADDRARAHEQQRLEERVGHQVKQAGAVRGHRDAQDHVADLGDRRVGDHPLEVGDHERHGGGEDQRGRADDRAHVGGRRRELEQRVTASDQVHAGRDHRGRVDQGRHRGGALHGVGEPGVQRQLGGLRERAHQDQQAGRDEGSVVEAKGLLRPGEHSRVVERAGPVEQQEGGDHQADVADHVDHEGLDAGVGGGRAPVPERDEQVGGGAHEGPAHDQQHEVGRQDQHEHREDEEVEVGEVAREAAVAAHVRHGVHVDQERDPADHQAHEHGERIDQDRHVDVEIAGGDVGPRRVDERALVRRVVLQLHEGADRRQERAEDRRAGDPARQPRSRPQVSETIRVPPEGRRGSIRSASSARAQGNAENLGESAHPWLP